MPTLSKREVEMEHGLAMLRLLGIESNLEMGIEPAPDLLFSLGGKKVGLEHTRIFADDGASPGAFQAYERVIETVAEGCRNEYISRGHPPVEVKLVMARQLPAKARVSILIEWIVNAVAENLPGIPGSIELRNAWTGEMPEEVDAIRMIRFPGQTFTSFFPPRSAWMRTIETEWLQRKIDDKAQRIPGYLSACDEVWLLMVEEQAGLSSTMDIPEAFWSQPFNTHAFAKVWYLRGRTKLHPVLALGTTE